MPNYLSSAATEYTRSFSGFRGVDLSSEAELVGEGRFCHLVNMWRDYASGQGDAVETFPGFRCLNVFEGRINGIFRYRTREGEDYTIVHAGTHLHRFLHAERDNIAASVKSFNGMADAPSTAFIFADKLYLLDGVRYRCFDGEALRDVSESGYVPMTYIDGVEYEQRNMLVDRTRERTEYVPSPTAVRDPMLMVYNESTEDHKTCRYYCLGDATKTVRADLRISSDWPQVVNEDNQYQPRALVGVDVLVLTADENDNKLRVLALNNWFFLAVPNLKKLYFEKISSPDFFSSEFFEFDQSALPAGCEVYWGTAPDLSGYYMPDIKEYEDGYSYPSYCEASASTAQIYSKVDTLISVKADGKDIPYNAISEKVREDDGEKWYIRKVIVSPEHVGKQLEVEVECAPSVFASAGEFLDFYTGNPEYEGTTLEAINRCTVSCQFDGRLFFTGNPALPNTIFYTQRNLTGYNDPTYIGILNYVSDGVGNTPNTAMVAASGTLMVFKGDTAQDGSVYYHTGQDTDSDLVPRIYPSTAGVPGIGCLGAAVNFYDDVCFLSRRGLEAIGKQTVNLERTVEHRSSNVDRALIGEELSRARFAEWDGYLVILCGSRAYLADSRQIFRHATGVSQYEWYLIDDLCTYRDTRACYRGTEELPWLLVGGEEVSLGAFAFPDGNHLSPIGDGEDIDRDAEEVWSGEVVLGNERMTVHYVLRDGVPCYVEQTGEVQGLGEAAPASAVGAIEDVLYFGTEDGSLCCINTDKRGVPYGYGDGAVAEVESDQIHRLWYTHDRRRYLSGFATSLDDAGYPHLLKSTVKKSCVLKMKTLSGGGFRVQSRTDRTSWRQVQRSGGTVEQVISADVGGFDDMSFGAVNFAGDGGITVPIMEKEKKWVEKQLYLYSDSFARPFGIFGLAYRFTIAGRIKK